MHIRGMALEGLRQNAEFSLVFIVFYWIQLEIQIKVTDIIPPQILSESGLSD